MSNIYIQADIEAFEDIKATYELSLNELTGFVKGNNATCHWAEVSSAATTIAEIQGKVEVLTYVIRTLKESLQLGKDKPNIAISRSNSIINVPAEQERRTARKGTTRKFKPEFKG